MKIEVSNGEIVDKLTILEIKLDKIKDEKKLENIRLEYEVLNESATQILSKEDPLYKKLREVNSRLWDIEDQCRDYERQKDFGEGFIHTVRQVYINNDERSRIKKEINEQTGSQFIEEKSYEDY